MRFCRRPGAAGKNLCQTLDHGGNVLGLIAAFSKGLVEDGLMKLSDFVFAFPALLLAIMLTSTFGPGVVNAIIAIGVYNVPIIAKLTRATARVLRQWRRKSPLLRIRNAFREARR